MTGRALLVTVMGLGRLTPAPGTWGSAIVPAAALVLVSAGAGALAVSLILAAVAAAFAVVCVTLGGWAEAHFERPDPPQVVADEVCGQAIALLALPWRAPGDAGAFTWNLAIAATGFIAFRFFDIVKLPPADSLQRVPRGWGIVLDDVAAGLMALAAAQLLARFVWPQIV